MSDHQGVCVTFCQRGVSIGMGGAINARPPSPHDRSAKAVLTTAQRDAALARLLCRSSISGFKSRFLFLRGGFVSQLCFSINVMLSYTIHFQMLFKLTTAMRQQWEAGTCGWRSGDSEKGRGRCQGADARAFQTKRVCVVGAGK